MLYRNIQTEKKTPHNNLSKIFMLVVYIEMKDELNWTSSDEF